MESFLVISEDTEEINQSLEEKVQKDDRIACLHCGRGFSKERVGKHQQICEGVSRSKNYFEKKRPAKVSEKMIRTKAQVRLDYPNSKWQKQHIDMIKKLRFDESTEEYEEYVNCPHCLRRFAPIPAEKHIPVCKDIINKPNPPRYYNILPKIPEKKTKLLQKFIENRQTPRNSSFLCNTSRANEGGHSDRVMVKEKTIQNHPISISKKIKIMHLSEPRSKSIYKIAPITCKCGEIMPNRAIYCMMCGNCKYG